MNLNAAQNVVAAARTVLAAADSGELFDLDTEEKLDRSVAAFDALESAVQNYDNAIPALPSVAALHRRFVSIETIFWVGAVLDHTVPLLGEGFQDLVDELGESGTRGVAREETLRIAHAIRGDNWEGLIARVSCPHPRGGHFIGVIAVEAFEQLVPAASAWADLTLGDVATTAKAA